MRFDFAFGPSRPGARRTGRERVRVLVLADLMGAGSGSAPPLPERRVVDAAADSFDALLARFTPSVALPSLGLDRPLRIESLDDFHPDALFQKVETFARLRSLRQRLQDPSTFEAAAAELHATASAGEAASDAPPSSGGEDRGALLERLLGANPAGGSTTSPARQRGAEAGVDAFIRSLVAPHIVQAADARVPQLVSAVDVALGDAMRLVLHAPAFQRLEATWRSVRWLLDHTTEFGEDDVEIGLLHMTREELSAGSDQEPPLVRHLEPRGVDGSPWSLLVTESAFGPADLAALHELAAVAARVQVPTFAAADHAMVGSHDLATAGDPERWSAPPADAARAWDALLASPGGRWLSLAWPRLLLRLPYGARTEPIEAFAFEELSGDSRHGQCLWGSGAFAAALVSVRARLGIDDASATEIVELPAFTVRDGEETVLKPCAELYLSERAVEAALARGFTPLASYRNRNAIRIVRIQPIAAGT